MLDYEITPGMIIVAPPRLPDPRFRDTVVMITSYDHSCTQGLVLNRPTKHTLRDLVEQVDLDAPTGDHTLYWGGPIDNHTVWLLHDQDWSLGSATKQINDVWSVTSSMSMFDNMSSANEPRLFRICHGQAVWAPGQLEMEIRGETPWSKNHSWLILRDPNPEWLMDQDPERLWADAVGQSAHQAVDLWL